jgi:hypothetical protein
MHHALHHAMHHAMHNAMHHAMLSAVQKAASSQIVYNRKEKLLGDATKGISPRAKRKYAALSKSEKVMTDYVTHM